jgi:hypothetical protein
MSRERETTNMVGKVKVGFSTQEERGKLIMVVFDC